MGCISEVPPSSRIRGYDYCNGVWRKVATQASGEIIIARGETLITAGTVLAPDRSGGIVLGSGAVERVVIGVPLFCCSGTSYNTLSGHLYGVWIGGRSGTGYEPIPDTDCLISGRGLFVEPGHEKTVYVRDLKEIHVAGMGNSGICVASGVYGSGIYDGWPVTFLGEQLVC